MSDFESLLPPHGKISNLISCWLESDAPTFDIGKMVKPLFMFGPYSHVRGVCCWER